MTVLDAFRHGGIALGEAGAPNNDYGWEQFLPILPERLIGSERNGHFTNGVGMKRLSSGQVPGVYRRDVGDIAVATINDGMIPANFDHIVGADPRTCEAEHRAAARPMPPWLTLNCYLIETSDQLVLIDAGYANTLPSVGRLLPNLAFLGIKPTDIDAVLMTHLHADHDAGLIDKEGAAVFPRAELVAHEDELTFWRDDRSIALLSEGQKVDFSLATNVLAAYADRVRPARAGDFAPGISALPTPGHTPGHTAWRIASGSEQLLIWGDVVHLPGVQFAIPEASVIYDVDSSAAAATRRQLLDMVSTDRIPVAGIHLDFPGFGLVAKGSNGRYHFASELWKPVI